MNTRSQKVNTTDINSLSDLDLIKKAAENNCLTFSRHQRYSLIRKLSNPKVKTNSIKNNSLVSFQETPDSDNTRDADISEISENENLSVNKKISDLINKLDDKVNKLTKPDSMNVIHTDTDKTGSTRTKKTLKNPSGWTSGGSFNLYFYQGKLRIKVYYY